MTLQLVMTNRLDVTNIIGGILVLKKEKSKTGMARLMQLAATKKPLIIGAIFLSALASIAGFIPYIAIYLAIREILGVWPEFGGQSGAAVIGYGWLAFGGVAANILLYFGALTCSHLAAFGTLYDLKVNFASHLARVPLGLHMMVGSGKLRKIMDENIEKIEGFIAHQLPDLAASLIAPVVMVGILLYVDWRMGLAALLGVVLAFGIQMKMYGNEGAKKMMDQYQASMEDMNNASVEYIRGISVVKAFRQTVYSFRRLRDTIKTYTSFVIPFTLSWETPYSACIAIVNNIYLFVAPVGILIGSRAADTEWISSFIFYLIFVPSIASVLMKVMYVNSGSMRILGGVEAMDAILNEPELTQPAKPRTVSRHDVVFQHVHFSYDKTGGNEALRDVSFTAKQGEVTAIVGPSGGGKSTIAHLIPRFFDVDSGAITIGGEDVREMSSTYLMDQVSFVFQDVFLFKQSVMENIRMGNQDAADEQVIEAAKAARCHDFIQQLPDGYHTVIGTRGVHLSGGERQRIAIARAIAKDAPIVVLDEATAFADPENEHLIQKAFETLMRNKTVIIIAHRLSTIQSADNIVVVDEGRIVEQGSHDTLLAMKNKYSAMWNTYMNTANWTMDQIKEAAGHA